MKPKEKRILETFKNMLEQRVHLNTFALFGSRARGDAGRYSDMDVLVVVDQLDTSTADYISDCAWMTTFKGLMFCRFSRLADSSIPKPGNCR